MRSKDERTVLVLDDEIPLAKMIARDLRRHGYDVTMAHTLDAARRLLQARPVNFAIVDLNLPDGDGADVVQWALRNELARVACVMTGAAECANVVRAMQNGSATVFEKPVRPEDLRDFLDAHLETDLDDLTEWRASCAPAVLGSDPQLLEQLEIAQQIAPSDCTVLVTGETGTGKELFAQAIHAGSDRAGQAFVALNCAAVPESLIEDELFGHTAGAFTGANQVRGGRIAAADGGTLFLDEIGDMPLPAQAKLLRFLEEGRIMPVGADLPQEVDVRVVAATNRDLEAMARQGQFRADLLYRLNVIQLRLPSLRERSADVVPLAKHFLAAACRHHRRGAKTLSATAEARLVAHHWPGNVRELKNTIERAVLTCPADNVEVRHLRLAETSVVPPAAPTPTPTIAPAAVAPQPVPPLAAPPPLLGPTIPAAPVAPSAGGQVVPFVPAAVAAAPAELAEAEDDNLDLKAALREREKELIQRALEQTNGNRTEAAALLGLNRTTLVEKIRKVGI